MKMVNAGESWVRAACGVVLATSVTAVAATATWGASGGGLEVIESGFTVGTVAPASLAVRPETQATLFVFLRRDCPASRRTAAWMTELTATLADEQAIRTVAVFPAEGGADELAFGASVGIGPNNLTSVSFAALPLEAVPSFVLLDEHRRVRFQRAGAVDPADRPTFLRDVSNAVN